MCMLPQNLSWSAVQHCLGCRFIDSLHFVLEGPESYWVYPYYSIPDTSFVIEEKQGKNATGLVMAVCRCIPFIRRTLAFSTTLGFRQGEQDWHTCSRRCPCQNKMSTTALHKEGQWWKSIRGDIIFQEYSELWSLESKLGISVKPVHQLSVVWDFWLTPLLAFTCFFLDSLKHILLSPTHISTVETEQIVATTWGSVSACSMEGNTGCHFRCTGHLHSVQHCTISSFTKTSRGITSLSPPRHRIFKWL